MSKKKEGDKAAISLIRARIKQLEEKMIEVNDVMIRSKDKYEVLTELIDEMENNKVPKREIEGFKKRREEHLKENKDASREFDSMRNKYNELKELIEIIDGGSKEG